MGSGGLPFIEYAVVVGSLIGTTLVGLYFSKGKGSLEQYVFGDRRMSVLPITLSISATLISGSSLVTVGMETYLYGAQTMVSIYAMVIGSLLCYFFYVPVLRSLKTVSPYEYFDRRFEPWVRKFVSVISVLDMFAATSLYTPALTFSQATDVHYFTIACGLGVLCLIYTVTGGLKAVAWADSIQILIVTVCAVCFFSIGLFKAGGVSEVVRKVEDGDRLEYFNLDPSPFQRLTLWTGLGVVFMWAPHYLSPSQHQRFMSLSSETDVKKVVVLSIVLMCAIVAFNCSLGLVAYAYFAGCDPKLAQKNINSYSTIIPYFVSEISTNLPGLTGLFYSSVLAAGLSSVTSMWNTLGCIILEDLVTPFLKVETLENTSYRIILALVFAIALITMGCVYLMPAFGSLMEVAIIMRSCSQSTMFVIFNTGLFLPWINSKGVVAGGFTTAFVTVYVIVESIKARNAGLVKDFPKILSVEKCNMTSLNLLTNMTLTAGMSGYGSHSTADESVLWLFKLSPYLYMIPGVVLGILAAIFVSFATGFQNLYTVNPHMIVRQMHWVLPNVRRTRDGSLGKTYDEIPMKEISFQRRK